MTCSEFREWFQDHESDEITDSIQAHLTECDKCLQIYELDQRLETKLKNNFEQLEVPERLQKRLQQNMAGRSRWIVQPHLLRKIAAPALAIAAMLVLFLFPMASDNSSFASMDELGQLAISDHLNHGIEGCTSEAILDLPAWSQKELGYKVNTPELPEGAKLLAVAVCRLGDCDTAHLMYSRGTERFSVFVFPEKEAGFRLAAGRSYSLDFGNHQVTLWQSGEQIQAMVI